MIKKISKFAKMGAMLLFLNSNAQTQNYELLNKVISNPSQTAIENNLRVDAAFYNYPQEIYAYVNDIVDRTTNTLISNKNIHNNDLRKIAYIIDHELSKIFFPKKNVILSKNVKNVKNVKIGINCTHYANFYQTIITKYNQNTSQKIDVDIIRVGNSFLSHSMVKLKQTNQELYWDPTIQSERTRESVIQQYGISNHAIETGLYLKPLSQKDIIAQEIVNHSVLDDFDEKELTNLAISINSKYGVAQYNKLILEIKNQKFSDLEKTIDTILLYDSLSSRAICAKGILLENQKNFEEATKKYRRAFELDKNNYEALINEANMHIKQQNSEGLFELKQYAGTKLNRLVYRSFLKEITIK